MSRADRSFFHWNHYLYKRLAWKAAGLLIVASLFSFLYAPTAQAVVQLLSFTAIAEEDYVIVEWVTRGEVNNDGFYVQRSTEQNTGYTRISELIEGMVDYPEEMGYDHLDFDVVSGVTYWYRLEMVDLDGSIQLSNPISVTPGAETVTPGGQTSPTVSVTTPTTTTATLAATATATTAGAYPAPPTQSGYPGPALAPPPGATAAPITPTPGLSPAAPTQATTSTTQTPTTGVTVVITGSQSLAATATLIPLPEFKLVFPRPREAALLVTATPQDGDGTPPWKVPQRVVPLALVFLIWVILGGWFYYSQRNLG